MGFVALAFSFSVCGILKWDLKISIHFVCFVFFGFKVLYDSTWNCKSTFFFCYFSKFLIPFSCFWYLQNDGFVLFDIFALEKHVRWFMIYSYVLIFSPGSSSGTVIRWLTFDLFYFVRGVSLIWKQLLIRSLSHNDLFCR